MVLKTDTAAQPSPSLDSAQASSLLAEYSNTRFLPSRRLDDKSIRMRSRSQDPESKEGANRLCALDLWWVVRVVCVDGKREDKSATLVHAYQQSQQNGTLMST